MTTRGSKFRYEFKHHGCGGCGYETLWSRLEGAERLDLQGFERLCPDILRRFAKRAILDGNELIWWPFEHKVETNSGFFTLIPILKHGRLFWQRDKPSAYGMRGRQGGVEIKRVFAYPYYWMAAALTPTQARTLLNHPPKFQLLRTDASELPYD